MRSTKDIENWRAAYAGPDEATLQWWDAMRKRSNAAIDTINNMPFMFDPAKFQGQTTDQMRQAIRPGSSPTAAVDMSQISSLLQPFLDQISPLLQQGGGATSASSGPPQMIMMSDGSMLPNISGHTQQQQDLINMTSLSPYIGKDPTFQYRWNQAFGQNIPAPPGGTT